MQKYQTFLSLKICFLLSKLSLLQPFGGSFENFVIGAGTKGIFMADYRVASLRLTKRVYTLWIIHCLWLKP